MYFTLAVSAATPEQCTALAGKALATDPRVMPIPGPAAVAWQSPDGRAALLHWGTGRPEGEAVSASRAGTIWADQATATLRARTSLTRVDPVYVGELRGAVVLSDRAMWAAGVAGTLGETDPLHICALLTVGFPLATATPFPGISALEGARRLEARGGSLATDAAGPGETVGPGSGPERVAAALVAAVAPLAALAEPVELSLTGGKDSRLVLAALVKAGVPVRAKTHGFPEHPDVAVAAEIASRLGIEHDVRTPAAPEAKIDVATRIRATVLVADGMLSSFENVGRPDHAPGPVPTAGGHGGELLRGGYAETVTGGRPLAPGVTATLKRTARATELLRRLTTRHLGLVRPAAAAGYLASLAPWSAATVAHGPMPALEEFYLVNRAGRWSAAARQAYLLRENLTQPLFDEAVVRAARSTPLLTRVSGTLTAMTLDELAPELAGVPYAGKPAKGAVPQVFDWRRQYGEQMARFLRDYTLDLGTVGGLFDVVSRAAAEKALTPPHADRGTVWALATLACLVSGDYRNARDPAPLLSTT